MCASQCNRWQSALWRAFMCSPIEHFLQQCKSGVRMSNPCETTKPPACETLRVF